MKSASVNVPNILKKLGAMTGIRDAYLVEHSLLRTLGSLLGVSDTSFYRVDSKGDIGRVLHHSRTEIIENGVKRVVDNIEEVFNEHEIPPHVRGLIESVRILNKSCCRPLENGLVVCYPMFVNSQVVGYFVFQRGYEASLVEDATIQGVLQVFTNYSDLLETSQRDPLTGLLNRYSLEGNLDRLWNILSTRLEDVRDDGLRRVSVPQRYWLGVLDIDHFKVINDTYGHIIGDEIIIMVSRLLQTSFRQTDLLYRYGGEEFVAIIAANDMESAGHTFERARLKIEQFLFPQVGRVTVSGGFSGADPSILPQQVLSRADSALYAAKNSGRNRVHSWEQLVDEGVLHEVATGDIDLF